MRGDGMLIRSVDQQEIFKNDSISIKINLFNVNKDFFINISIDYSEKKKPINYDHDVALMFQNNTIKLIQFISSNTRKKQTSFEFLFSVPQSTLDEIIKSPIKFLQYSQNGADVHLIPLNDAYVIQKMYDCLKHY
jgi:hypothetical protein